MKYSELLVWQKAVDLVTTVYRLTAARLEYLENEHLVDVLKRANEIGKMLSGLSRPLNPQSSILNPA